MLSLNSTVAQLAKAVNGVLTKTYNMLYTEGDDDSAEAEEPPQLRLQTAPLASSEEVEKLFTAQIIDLQTALPAAMHALGATADEVERALQRGMEKEKKKCDCEDEDRAMQKRDAELNMKERTLGLEKTKADMCAAHRLNPAGHLLAFLFRSPVPSPRLVCPPTPPLPSLFDRDAAKRFSTTPKHRTPQTPAVLPATSAASSTRTRKKERKKGKREGEGRSGEAAHRLMSRTTAYCAMHVCVRAQSWLLGACTGDSMSRRSTAAR